MQKRKRYPSSERFFPETATICLDPQSFNENDHQRAGSVDINFLPNAFYKTFEFLWRGFNEPGSVIQFFDGRGQEVFKLKAGDERAYAHLTKERQEIVTGFYNLFHAREDHIEGYDGNGPVPLSIPDHLKSGSNMKVAV